MSAGLHPFVNEADGGGRREGEGGAPPLGDAVTDAPPGGVRSGAPRRAHSMSAGEQREPRCMSAGLHPLAAPLGPMCAWHASLGAPASAALHPLPAASLPKPACGMCGMCDMCDMYGGERGGERPGGGEAAGGAGGGGGNAADMNGGRSASCGARMQRRPATAPRTAAGTAAGTEAGAKVSEVSEGGGGCSGGCSGSGCVARGRAGGAGGEKRRDTDHGVYRSPFRYQKLRSNVEDPRDLT